MKRLKWLSVLLSIACCTANAAVPVFDAPNYAQNLKQTYQSMKDYVNNVRRLYYDMKSVENQVNMLKNQASMLSNDKNNFKRLDFNSLDQFFNTFDELTSFVDSTDYFAKNAVKVKQQLDDMYPDLTSLMPSTPEEIKMAALLNKNKNAIRKTLSLSGITDNVKDDKKNLQNFLDQSKNAKGSLQAQQAQAELTAMLINNMNQIKLLTNQLLKDNARNMANGDNEKARRIRLRDELLKGYDNKTAPNNRTKLPMFH